MIPPDYSVDIPAGDGGNTISVSVVHDNEARRYALNFTCTCDRLVYLVMKADESPSHWVMWRTRWQDIPTAEEEIATARLAAELYQDMDDFEKAVHHAGAEKREEEEIERVQESEAARRLLFTPTTICECGRRYRYLGETPWIAAESAGAPESPDDPPA